MHPRIPAAASPLTLGLLTGTPRPAVVLAAFPTALYLGLPEHATVLPVVTSDALVLPTAVRLPTPGPRDWGVAVGDVVNIGGYVISLPSHGIRVVRSWRPRQVTAAPMLPDCYDWSALLDEVGLGEGLTPRADDVLCGALLAARALGLDLPTELPLTRTTSLSASLVAAAAKGYAVSTVVDHVTAVAAGCPDLAPTRAAVLGIGHTSGEALLEGVDRIHDFVNSPLPEGIPS